MTSEWVSRPHPRGWTAVCMRCGVTVSGDLVTVAGLEEQHDGAACAARALTPEALRFRGGR